MKQGDPLSPTLFIIAAEALTRSINALNGNEKFIKFGVPKWSLEINHLSYVDDTIFFYFSRQMIYEVYDWSAQEV